MKRISFYLFLTICISISPSYGQSNLLDSVKKNPKDAIAICNKFKDMNSNGISANSQQAINYVAKKNKVSPLNAEILSIYIIGLYCPKVI